MKIALVLLFCLAAATTAQARPLKSFCERFEPLRKISDLKYIKHRMRVEPSTPGVKVQDVRFTIEAKAGVIRISPNAEGFVELPLTEALCAENP
ncbi:MAG: hypothetical protein ABIQ72_19090, partial [Usitatibacter sp.]